MKKTNRDSDQPRIFSRRKARELETRELETITGGMQAATHCFCPGGGEDDCDVY